MEQTLLNRLVAARHLLESCGPSLTISSPQLLLAQKLLAAHDAVELVFSALSSIPGATPLGRDGQINKDPSFMDLSRAVVKAAIETGKVDDRAQIKTLQDLADARKVFKHSGLIIDSRENGHLFDNTITILDEVTVALVGVSVSNVDRSSAIQNDSARYHFERAREAIHGEQFKNSLEQVAFGLSSAFLRTPFMAGKPDSEDALLLSGYGIDPSSFLALQRLLPLASHMEAEPRWDLRKFGHAANWTKENAEFCLQVAVDLVAKLERAIQQPQAMDFYDHYEDVIEIMVDNPTVFFSKRFFYSNDPMNERQVSQFSRGDKIRGRATGRTDRESPFTAGLALDLDDAEWIALESAKTERINVEGSWGQRSILWFRSDQAKVSYQVNEDYERIRNRLREAALEESQ